MAASGRRCPPSGGLIWAATGHRPDKLKGYDDGTLERYTALACRFFMWVQPAKVISGMALGWDTAVALAAIRCNIPLIAAIPFEGQELRWPLHMQARYRTIRNWSTDIAIVSPGGFSVRSMQARNEWMVDRCDWLAAMWDGSHGGTFNCIEYATRRNPSRPIINLWDKRPA